MDEEQKHHGRGGARPGAGRPRTYSKLLAFRAPKEVAEYIEKHPNKSKLINSCIIRNMAAENAASLKDLGRLIPAGDVNPVSVPLVDLSVVAGFPVPLDNSEQTEDVELLQRLCPHKDTSYLVHVTGDSMIDADIHSGDILVVDSSVREPSEKQIAICEVNSEYTVKRVKHEEGNCYLIPANPKYPRIEVKPTDNFHVWGIVTYIIHKA